MKKETIKQLKNLIKEARDDCWEYHKDILKENKYTKSQIGQGDFDFSDWEDVGYMEGKIYGLECAIELLEKD